MLEIFEISHRLRKLTTDQKVGSSSLSGRANVFKGLPRSTPFEAPSDGYVKGPWERISRLFSAEINGRPAPRRRWSHDHSADRIGSVRRGARLFYLKDARASHRLARLAYCEPVIRLTVVAAALALFGLLMAISVPWYY